MKIKKVLFIMIIAAFLLSACSKPKAEDLTEATLAQVYTSVAMTLSANATAAPTVTPTIQPTVTLIPTMTQAQSLATPTSLPTSKSVSTCDNSAYVSDETIPDGTVIYPGETFTKTWRIKNSGTCEWTTSFHLVFAYGSSMNGAQVAISETVAAGKTTTVSVKMTAPTTEGTYTGYWVMQNAEGKNFGEYVYVQIASSTNKYTKTPTGTITTTPTSTSAYTNTPTSTTAASTSTPTVTVTTPPAPTETTTTEPTLTTTGTLLP